MSAHGAKAQEVLHFIAAYTEATVENALKKPEIQSADDYNGGGKVGRASACNTPRPVAIPSTQETTP